MSAQRARRDGLDFPTAWRHFVDAIPPEDRGDVVKGLAKMFSAPPRTDEERERLVRAASASSRGKAAPAA